MPFDIKDGITLSIAAVGAVLGVVNTLHSFNQKRVKPRVVPKYAHLVNGGVFSRSEPIGRVGSLDNEEGCIEVINLSTFAVNIGQIGFTQKMDAKQIKMMIPEPMTADKKPFARRLEPREAVTGYFPLGGFTQNIKKAYAQTDCGTVAYGTSPALKEMIRRTY